MALSIVTQSSTMSLWQLYYCWCSFREENGSPPLFVCKKTLACSPLFLRTYLCSDRVSPSRSLTSNVLLAVGADSFGYVQWGQIQIQGPFGAFQVWRPFLWARRSWCTCAGQTEALSCWPLCPLAQGSSSVGWARHRKADLAFIHGYGETKAEMRFE